MSPVYIRIDRKQLGFGRCVIGELYLSTPAHPMPYRCTTLEIPWRHNMSKISCIPPGRFKAFVKTSPQLKRPKHRRRGWRIELKGTGHRGNIHIHWGYDENDSEGCILIGERYDGRKLVRPKEAREDIRKIVQKAGKKPEIWVEIREHGPATIKAMSEVTMAPWA